MSKLNALKVKNLKRPGRYVDGDGLMLFIGKDGSRRWVLRIQVNGRRRDIGLGSAKDITLSDAREDAGKMRRAFKRGRDPVAERKAALAIPTFREVAKAVHQERGPGWRNAKHRAQWLSTLESYVFPKLGDKTVDKIDSALVRDVLADFWLTRPETARRVMQRVGTVLDYAHSKGWRRGETPRRAIKAGLAKQQTEERHFKSMPWEDVPGFVASMSETLRTNETTLLLLEFIVLTASRSGEARGARWFEIDREAKCWTVPAERMKAKKEHRVPLSVRALAILERMAILRRDAKPDALIFEGRSIGKPISDMTMRQALRRAGLLYDVHGFRSSFKDWSQDATNFPSALSERALAHTIRNKVERAYAKSDLFERRRELMEAWATFCTSPSGNVVALDQMRKAHN